MRVSRNADLCRRNLHLVASFPARRSVGYCCKPDIIDRSLTHGRARFLRMPDGQVQAIDLLQVTGKKKGGWSFRLISQHDSIFRDAEMRSEERRVGKECRS